MSLRYAVVIYAHPFTDLAASPLSSSSSYSDPPSLLPRLVAEAVEADRSYAPLSDRCLAYPARDPFKTLLGPSRHLRDHQKAFDVADHASSSTAPPTTSRVTPLLPASRFDLDQTGVKLSSRPRCHHVYIHVSLCLMFSGCERNLAIQRHQRTTDTDTDIFVFITLVHSSVLANTFAPPSPHKASPSVAVDALEEDFARLVHSALSPAHLPSNSIGFKTANSVSRCLHHLPPLGTARKSRNTDPLLLDTHRHQIRPLEPTIPSYTTSRPPSYPYSTAPPTTSLKTPHVVFAEPIQLLLFSRALSTAQPLPPSSSEIYWVVFVQFFFEYRFPLRRFSTAPPTVFLNLLSPSRGSTGSRLVYTDILFTFPILGLAASSPFSTAPPTTTEFVASRVTNSPLDAAALSASRLPFFTILPHSRRSVQAPIVSRCA
ncbi:hypothetical protein ONZ45_g12026 [Pleurotus djamor]|nr:hypothetical protein ONZ45_g12026 [Pleurotus djamor]